MPLGSRLKPVMVRAEGWFTVFGRIGVMPGQAETEKNPADALKRQLKISDSIFLWFQTA
ncbi:hypothetical protein [Escherichia coli ISC7]|uniref:Uncharacterized protein n=1 Tax=Escherichia coli ISC7 TaxID=1432555 RepID=W1F5Y7_ECOLX|nr:hypothetical protein [Escherichia coli ISC7]